MSLKDDPEWRWFPLTIAILIIIIIIVGFIVPLTCNAQEIHFDTLEFNDGLDLGMKIKAVMAHEDTVVVIDTLWWEHKSYQTEWYDPKADSGIYSFQKTPDFVPHTEPRCLIVARQYLDCVVKWPEGRWFTSSNEAHKWLIEMGAMKPDFPNPDIDTTTQYSYEYKRYVAAGDSLFNPPKKYTIPGIALQTWTEVIR